MDFQLSDEDFLEQQAPVVDKEEAATSAVSTGPTQEELDNQARLDQEEADRLAAEQTDANADVVPPKPGDADYVEPTVELKPGDEGYVEPEEGKQPVTKTAAELAAEVEAAKNPANPLVDGVTPVNYEEAYKNMMKPLRANGKDIELRSPEELIKLAQQGANFTQKMQQIAPVRKLMLMLQNNNLLSEDKLSYLIDLDKKNPEAIKQLLKDAGVDPMDIDTSVAPAYQQGNHKVTDEEANFQATLDSLSGSAEGKATIQVINTTWDQASKDVLWSNPQLMEIMHEQQQSGLYETVSAEIERQRLFGQLPATMSFLEAYKVVGDQMLAAEAGKKQTPAQTPVAVARTAPVKPAATESERAKAAGATRTTPRQAKVVVNPLGMSDDDFLKQFNGRL